MRRRPWGIWVVVGLQIALASHCCPALLRHSRAHRRSLACPRRAVAEPTRAGRCQHPRRAVALDAQPARLGADMVLVGVGWTPTSYCGPTGSPRGCAWPSRPPPRSISIPRRCAIYSNDELAMRTRSSCATGAQEPPDGDLTRRIVAPKPHRARSMDAQPVRQDPADIALLRSTRRSSTTTSASCSSRQPSRDIWPSATCSWAATQRDQEVVPKRARCRPMTGRLRRPSPASRCTCAWCRSRSTASSWRAGRSAATDELHAPGRLARVGLFGACSTPASTRRLLVRGTVPGGTAAAAQIKYAAARENDPRYVYYGRVVRRRGWIILQYLFFYFMNDYRSTFHGVNDHEADWEQVFVYLEDAPDGPHRCGSRPPRTTTSATAAPPLGRPDLSQGGRPPGGLRRRRFARHATSSRAST